MKKYQIIYADPPWSYGTSKLNRPSGGKEITDHYPVMEDADILALPVKELAHRHCWLFLWVVYAKLPLALEVIKTWGFKYATVGFEWFKLTTTGLPVCFMGGSVCGGAIELCLIGKRGNLPRASKRVHRLIEAPRHKHSRKPPEIRQRIVQLVGDVPRIELFSRKEELLFDADYTNGWDIWGNEVDSDIELQEGKICTT